MHNPPRSFPKIKVCGLTSVEDARHAIQFGADAVGVVGVLSSPRGISSEKAREVFQGLSNNLWKIAVFVNPSPAEALSFLKRADANAVQLCGEENTEDWNDFPFPVFKKWGVAESEEGMHQRWKQICRGFILDSPNSPGGTGKTVDPVLAQKFAAQAPCLLAGGLHAENVGEKVAQIRPAGVDASSALEDSPGIKNKEHVQVFIQAAQRAFQRIEQ